VHLHLLVSLGLLSTPALTGIPWSVRHLHLLISLGLLSTPASTGIPWSLSAPALNGIPWSLSAPALTGIPWSLSPPALTVFLGFWVRRSATLVTGGSNFTPQCVLPYVTDTTNTIYFSLKGRGDVWKASCTCVRRFVNYITRTPAGVKFPGSEPLLWHGSGVTACQLVWRCLE
jgi:hypothetical protein